ncbi:hypothetical protein AbraIFM66951_007551 [Aspergillus brasiliensis]|uniref:Uncharacterized protein n=1 Tax=Aspergillus brasiliensis TaxID=319629 RepID=A0A9W5YKS4_9EURO|nr:hypothetical protein AbraCBS73388_008233 [Aspergillus brasiliensis]GKZ40997.1 hypothetical protein AbraIFM66951_007551 [Aspergillus brasiliensis]
MSITDRVVLVAGASKGIGRAIALQAGKEGAYVIVNYHTDAQGADKVVAEIGASRALAIQADISKPADIERLIKVSVARFGKIDVVIPNAAYVPLADVETATEEQFDMAFGVNVKGPWLLVQKSLPYMSSGSAVIFISSDLTDFSTLPPPLFLYISTKGALNLMVRSMAQTLASRGIRINAVSPGTTETDSFFKSNTDDSTRMLAQLNPFKRLGRPDEVAAAVSLLWRPESSWISGQVLKANGATC